MAKKPETRFQEKVLKELRLTFPDAWVTKIQAGSIIGIPDILACINGHFVAWELKRNAKEKPTRIQVYVLDAINKAGGHGRVVYPENFSDELQLLQWL